MAVSKYKDLMLHISSTVYINEMTVQAHENKLSYIFNEMILFDQENLHDLDINPLVKIKHVYYSNFAKRPIKTTVIIPHAPAQPDILSSTITISLRNQSIINQFGFGFGFQLSF